MYNYFISFLEDNLIKIFLNFRWASAAVDNPSEAGCSTWLLVNESSEVSDFSQFSKYKNKRCKTCPKLKTKSFFIQMNQTMNVLLWIHYLKITIVIKKWPNLSSNLWRLPYRVYRGNSKKITYLYEPTQKRLSRLSTCNSKF